MTTEEPEEAEPVRLDPDDACAGGCGRSVSPNGSRVCFECAAAGIPSP